MVAWAFHNSVVLRVPLTVFIALGRTLTHGTFTIENLRDGATIDQFLDWFPGVERRQIESVLDHETRDLKDSVA